MDKLTEPQKLFYLNQNLEREVNNGGFHQYFINSSGDYSHETIQSLKSIGATTTALILQRATDQFPNKTVPKDEMTEVKQSSKLKKSLKKFGVNLNKNSMNTKTTSIL